MVSSASADIIGVRSQPRAVERFDAPAGFMGETPALLARRQALIKLLDARRPKQDGVDPRRTREPRVGELQQGQPLTARQIRERLDAVEHGIGEITVLIEGVSIKPRPLLRRAVPPVL